MVKYYGRAKTRTGSVNTTQLGLKLAGCPSNVGRKGTLTRVVQRRVNCALKVCGWRPVHGVTGRKPGIFNFPSEPTNALAREAWSGPFPCTLAQPFTRGVKGGIGHIYTPRTKCGCTCVADCSGIDDTFFPVGTPLYGLPRCAGGDCCFLVTNAPICRIAQAGVAGAVQCFPGLAWRRMVSEYFDADLGPANLPPIDGGFNNSCWVTRQAMYEYSPEQAYSYDIIFAVSLALISINLMQEPLAGFSFPPTPTDDIDWAWLRVRSTAQDCKEHGGFGIWLLARTTNLDFAGSINPDVPNAQYGKGTTLSLYWLALSPTRRLVEDTPPTTPPTYSLVPYTGGIPAAFPVLRYHYKPFGEVVGPPPGTDISAVRISPYQDAVTLNECGCPEVKEGYPMHPLFQYWGLFYPNYDYVTNTAGSFIPWSLPAAYVDYDLTLPLGGAQSDSVKWVDFPTAPTIVNQSAAPPPIPDGWQKPDPCTFGAITDLTSLGNLTTTPPGGAAVTISTPSTGVLRWFCPQPPPGPYGWPPA